MIRRNLFYLVIDMFVIGATTAHKTFHSILVKCHSNQPLSDWFSKGFKEAKAQQPFTKLITGRESAFFFTTKSTLNPNSIQICTGNSVKLYKIVWNCKVKFWGLDNLWLWTGQVKPKKQIITWKWETSKVSSPVIPTSNYKEKSVHL